MTSLRKLAGRFFLVTSTLTGSHDAAANAARTYLELEGCHASEIRNFPEGDSSNSGIGWMPLALKSSKYLEAVSLNNFQVRKWNIPSELEFSLYNWISPDGNIIGYSTPDNTITFWHTQNNRIVKTAPLSKQDVYFSVYVPSEKFNGILYALVQQMGVEPGQSPTKPSQLIRIDVATGATKTISEWKTKWKLSDAPFWFTPNSKSLIFTEYNEDHATSLYEIDLSTGAVKTSPSVPTTYGIIETSDRQKRYLAYAIKRQIQMWAPGAAAPTMTRSISFIPHGIYFTSDERKIWAPNKDKRSVHIFDSATLKELQVISSADLVAMVSGKARYKHIVELGGFSDDHSRFIIGLSNKAGKHEESKEFCSLKIKR